MVQYLAIHAILLANTLRSKSHSVINRIHAVKNINKITWIRSIMYFSVVVFFLIEMDMTE